MLEKFLLAHVIIVIEGLGGVLCVRAWSGWGMDMCVFNGFMRLCLNAVLPCLLCCVLARRKVI